MPVHPHPLVEYFRCPEDVATLDAGSPLSPEPGYFTFRGATAYGRLSVGNPSPRFNGHVFDASAYVSTTGGRARLPFDLAEVVSNLRNERYVHATSTPLERISASEVANAVYYSVRPVLPVGVRKHLQRLRFSGWRRIGFPKWPVDVTVESLMKSAAGAVLTEGSIDEMPFVWFWPEGAEGCVMMTHDVEGPAGAAFVAQLLDLDEAFGMRSAIQIVPEAPYSRALLEQCRCRGVEVNVHDFNHDGHLFRDRARFDARVAEINRHAREFCSRGFRSGAMYRRQDWFSALDLSFDMSVPNLAHFEPQQGGCCTVMPHFIGHLVELPLTTTQDYALFHYLGDYATSLWKTQIDAILAQNGLVSFIAHPDYLRDPRARGVYVELLQHLTRLREERKLWMALPSEIDRWWRDRQAMTVVRDGAGWRVQGPGCERARVAYLRHEQGTTVCALHARVPARQPASVPPRRAHA